MTYDELAAHTRETTRGQNEHVAEGKDLLEAAVIAVEKAAYWARPQAYHEGQFESGVKIAMLRTNVALAVELRALRREIELLRLSMHAEKGPKP